MYVIIIIIISQLYSLSSFSGNAVSTPCPQKWKLPVCFPFAGGWEDGAAVGWNDITYSVSK